MAGVELPPLDLWSRGMRKISSAFSKSFRFYSLNTAATQCVSNSVTVAKHLQTTKHAHTISKNCTFCENKLF